MQKIYVVTERVELTSGQFGEIESNPMDEVIKAFKNLSEAIDFVNDYNEQTENDFVSDKDAGYVFDFDHPTDWYFDTQNGKVFLERTRQYYSKNQENLSLKHILTIDETELV